MVGKMDELGFGNCTNEAECEPCPKSISISNIARMNRQYLCAATTHHLCKPDLLISVGFALVCWQNQAKKARQWKVQLGIARHLKLGQT